MGHSLCSNNRHGRTCGVEKKQKSLFKSVVRSSESIKLEDELSAISYGEAIAWLSVCSFSPLATGAMLKLA